MDLDMLDMEDSDAPTLLFVLSNSQARSKFNSFAANERSTENVKFLVAYRDIITFIEVRPCVCVCLHGDATYIFAGPVFSSLMRVSDNSTAQ